MHDCASTKPATMWMILYNWLIGNSERGGRGEQEMWEGEIKREADRQIKRWMNGWMLGRMDGWMDERRGRVQREKRQQQLRTQAKMRGGGMKFYILSSWHHSLFLHSSFLTLFSHLWSRPHPRTHTYRHSNLWDSVSYCRGKRHFRFNKEAPLYFSPSLFSPRLHFHFLPHPARG